MSASVLTIDDLHVAYGQSEVLHGLKLALGRNEIVALMGRNGMGKTTPDEGAHRPAAGAPRHGAHR